MLDIQTAELAFFNQWPKVRTFAANLAHHLRESNTSLYFPYAPGLSGNPSYGAITTVFYRLMGRRPMSARPLSAHAKSKRFLSNRIADLCAAANAYPHL
jgi:hypothetical protein